MLVRNLLTFYDKQDGGDLVQSFFKIRFINRPNDKNILLGVAVLKFYLHILKIEMVFYTKLMARLDVNRPEKGI